MLFQPFQTRASSMALLPPSLLHVPIIQARIAVQCSHLSFPTRLCALMKVYSSFQTSVTSFLLHVPRSSTFASSKIKVEPWLPLHACTALILFFLLHHVLVLFFFYPEPAVQVCVGTAELFLMLSVDGGCGSS